MAIVGHLQQVGIVVDRSWDVGPWWLSQTRYVGNRLVEALVLDCFGVGRFEMPTLTDANKVLLDVGWRGVLGLALLVATMCDRGSERVADSTARAIPLALGRVLGIHGRFQTFKMESVFTCIAAKKIANLVALVAIVTVVRGLTVGSESARVFIDHFT